MIAAITLRIRLDRPLALARVQYYVAVLAVALSMMYSFALYPLMARPMHLFLDPDGYGALGMGLWHSSSLSYFPDHHPTVRRGPAYPAFIAFLLALTHGSYPYAIQVAQAILLGATCLLVYSIANGLWGRARAVLASALCALHPLLIWYTSRIWSETLATFLFTGLIAATLWLSHTPTTPRAVLLGSFLGVLALCKATFLPFLLVVPLLLALVREARIPRRSLISVVMIAFLWVIPWTARNWSLTGRVIPVHLLAGLNFQRGDSMVDNYLRAPLSYDTLLRTSSEKTRLIGSRVPPSVTGWQREVELDHLFLRDSAARYARDPRFLLKKLSLNAGLFWTLGETWPKTIVISALQIPLLGLFLRSALRLLRQKGARTIHTTHLSLVLLYMVSHLPIIAFARLSVVLIPTMLAYAVGRAGSAPVPDQVGVE